MKKFLIKLSVFSIPLLVLVGCYVFVMSNMTGDLGNLGMVPFGKYEVGVKPDFVNYYDCFSLEDAQDADIVVVGDSFTKRGINSYMNYLGNELGKSVCHLYIDDMEINPCAAADFLIENDLLPNCKTLILESVERHAVWRLRDCFNGGKLVFVERGEDAH